MASFTKIQRPAMRVVGRCHLVSQKGEGDAEALQEKARWRSVGLSQLL